MNYENIPQYILQFSYLTVHTTKFVHGLSIKKKKFIMSNIFFSTIKIKKKFERQILTFCKYLKIRF